MLQQDLTVGYFPTFILSTEVYVLRNSLLVAYVLSFKLVLPSTGTSLVARDRLHRRFPIGNTENDRAENIPGKGICGSIRGVLSGTPEIWHSYIFVSFVACSTANG